MGPRLMIEIGLDHVGLHAGVVRRAALKDDGKIRLHHPGCHGRAPGAHLLLNRAGSHHVHGQLLALELPEGLEDGDRDHLLLGGAGAHHVYMQLLAPQYVQGLHNGRAA